MLYDGYKMKPTDAQEELEEVQTDLRKREDEVSRLRWMHMYIVVVLDVAVVSIDPNFVSISDALLQHLVAAIL